jgi:hypothetical protein
MEDTKMKSVYSYKHWDGRMIDCSAMIDEVGKDATVAHVGRCQREHQLIRAIESFRMAGEIDLAAQVLSSPRYKALFAGYLKAVA